MKIKAIIFELAGNENMLEIGVSCVSKIKHDHSTNSYWVYKKDSNGKSVLRLKIFDVKVVVYEAEETV